MEIGIGDVNVFEVPLPADQGIIRLQASKLQPSLGIFLNTCQVASLFESGRCAVLPTHRVRLM